MTMFRSFHLGIAASLGVFAIAGLLAYRRMDAQPKQPALVIVDEDRSAAPGSAPVLVELFTSEGCSSCPPADALLARLDRDQPVANADIIILEEHVDYWDSLGWKDRFSSGYMTRRQKQYGDYFKLDDIYTPQTVVNGYMQYNGSDSKEIQNAIAKAAADKAVRLQFSSVKVRDGNITFTLQPGPPVPEFVRVYAALVDPEDTTEVPAGENKGRTLHHAGVVREFTLSGESWHMKELDRHPFLLAVQSAKIVDGMRLVVFAQVKPIGPVLGIASCTIGPETRATAPRPQSTPPANRCPPPGI